VTSPAELSDETLAPFLARAADLDFVLIGCGHDLWVMPEPLRRPFRDVHINADVMPTGAAVRTYNVLLAESRRVAAGLIAVD
jgi:uncharacterized protein